MAFQRTLYLEDVITALTGVVVAPHRQGSCRDPMAVAQNRDLAEHRDLHEGDVRYGQHRGGVR